MFKKIMVSSFLSGTWHKFFVRCVSWLHNRRICNSRVIEIILRGWCQFIGRLHSVDSRSQTQVLMSHCNIHKVLECSWLSILRCWINFYFSVDPNGLCSSSYTLIIQFMRVELVLSSLVHRSGILVNTQDCIRVGEWFSRFSYLIN